MSLNTRASTWCEPGEPFAVGGASEEAQGRRVRPARDRLLENVPSAPAREHLLLERGERGPGVDGSMDGGHAGPGILGPAPRRVAGRWPRGAGAPRSPPP